MEPITEDFLISGQNEIALFTLKVYRGEGMLLLAMNWKNGTPPLDFVGFAIEYKEPDGDKFYALKNRLSFLTADGKVNPQTYSTLQSPIQKFRWVHFPRNADYNGYFSYRVTPVFMNDNDELSYGESQLASIILKSETYPDELNVTFTRGFVSSQAFIDRYSTDGSVSNLIPRIAKKGLDFKPTNKNADEALNWMGFEAREAILKVLDHAISDDSAKVSVVAYDLNEPTVVNRLEQLKERLRIIIDNDGAHGEPDSAETEAEKRLLVSAGKDNVKRQHMGKLQHNKTIVVNGTKTKIAVCGSTNLSWRGFYVQNNNAVILKGEKAIDPFIKAFDNYWRTNSPDDFGETNSADPNDLGFENINAPELKTIEGSKAA